MYNNPDQSTSYLDSMMIPMAEDMRRQGELHLNLLQLLHAWPNPPVDYNTLAQYLNTTVQTTDLINMRNGMGINEPILKQLAQGTPLTLLDTTNEQLLGKTDQWPKVKDAVGSEGFVNGKFVVWLGGTTNSFSLELVLRALEYFENNELVELRSDKSNSQYSISLNERGHYLAKFIAQSSVKQG